MTDLFFTPVHVSAFYTVHIALIIIFLSIRLLGRESDEDLGDVMNQYFYAFKAFLQPSVSPLVKSRSGLLGRSYYTVGFYWFCGFLGRLSFSKKLFSPYLSDDGILFRGVNSEIASSLKCGALYLKLFSNIIFPFITFLVFSFLSINTFSPTFIGLILSSISLILIHAIYPTLNYIISTRSIGYVSIFFPAASLYLFYYSQSIAIGNIPDTNSIFFSHILSLSPYLLGISFFASVCFVFLSSQQGSQFIISFILSILFLDSDLGTIILTIFVTASFFMLQFPIFNYGQQIFTHLMNRFHESEWILRSYGYIRYAYNCLSPAQFKLFISDAIFHSYIADNFLTPYKKTNWLVSFLVYRVYLYSLIYLIFLSDTPLLINLVLFTKIVLSTCLVPAVLCNFQPFRGYGPPALYLNFFYPLMFFVFSTLVLNSYRQGYIESNILVNTFLVDSFVMGFFMFSQLLVSLFRLVRSTDFSSAIDTLIFYPERLTNISVAKIFNSLVNSPVPKGSCLSVFTPELHLQSMVEAALLLRNETTDYGRRPSLRLGWTMIDNLLYGFYSDYDAFTVKPQITDSYIRPDIILFDDNRRYPAYYYNVCKSGKLLLKSGPLSLVNTRPYYSKNINE